MSDARSRLVRWCSRRSRVCAIVVTSLVACSGSPALTPDAERGAALMLRAGCGSCHRIPGLPGAVGEVGPSLHGLRERQYLAGFLPNTPENMTAWLMHPERLQPRTVMPETGLSDAEARDVGAYLVR